MRTKAIKKNLSIYYQLFFGLLIICSAAFSLCLGEIPWNALWDQAKCRLQGISNEWNPLLDERIPRLIVIFCTGASLAVAGAVMQTLFHNPLASPNLLGVSCGGSLAVIMVFILDLHLEYPFVLPLSAFVGSLATLHLVYFLSRYKGETDLNSLILTGVAVSSLLIAIQAAILYAQRDHWTLIQTLTEWEAGSTLDRSWQHVHMQLPLALTGLYGCWYYRSEIDLLALGEEEAKSLGVEVVQIRWRLFLCVALLTGGAIAAVGMIAFFGLVLPHLMRALLGSLNRVLIPFCMLAGAATFAVLDNIIRAFEFHALTIGNVSAILGGIFLIFYRKRCRTA